MAVKFKKVAGSAPTTLAVMAQELEEAVTKVEELATKVGASVIQVHDSFELEVPKEGAASMKDLLASIGMTLVSAPVVTPLHIGDRVRVTNPLFPWVEAYKPGDCGEVLKNHPPIKEALQYGTRYGLLEVRMDSGALVILHTWEVERAA